ncbi:conserved hypothetical protein [Syntrophobacter sp. SbD1]|nr:conserved hypothetical protein [Syntrophobacter sp. SbD1]
MRRTSVAETCIGIFILVLLAAIAGGIYISQSMFDPGFYNAALQKDGNGTARRNSLPLPDAAPLPAYLPENLIPLGPEETFDPETLSDKIDGKAELYLSSGFVKLTTRRFAKKGNPGDWLELYIYDVGNPTNAFSVYSVQKRENSKPVDLGVSAYATEDALFFTNGPKYFEIISASKDISEEMTLLAKNLVEGEHQNRDQQTEISLFPPESLDKSSIALHMSDVFGFSALDHVYTASYLKGTEQITAFLSNRGSAEEATDLAAAYGRFLLENGGTEAGEVPDAPDSKIYKVFDTYEVVLHRGNFLAGTHEADNVEAATEVASRLYRGLGEAP